MAVDKLSVVNDPYTYFSFSQKNVHSKAFVGYICDNVLPHLDQLASPEEGVNGKLELLKLLAETSEFTGDLENLEQRLQNLYDCLIVSTH